MKILLFSALLGLLAACTSESQPEPASGQPSQSTPDNTDHGAANSLGTVTLGGGDFEIVLLGEVTPGEQCGFEVHPRGAIGDELGIHNLYIWIESEDGTQLCAPASAALSGAGAHFHVTPREGEQTPHHVVLRLRAGETDERASVHLPGAH